MHHCNLHRKLLARKVQSSGVGKLEALSPNTQPSPSPKKKRIFLASYKRLSANNLGFNTFQMTICLTNTCAQNASGRNVITYTSKMHIERI